MASNSQRRNSQSPNLTAAYLAYSYDEEKDFGETISRALVLLPFKNFTIKLEQLLFYPIGTLNY